MAKPTAGSHPSPRERSQAQPAISPRFMKAYVFVCGASVMAVEMAASRALAPYFGTSMLVWANLIGIIMIALSIGYFVGGKIADRNPSEQVLFKLVIGAGLFTAVIPFWTRPIFGLLSGGIFGVSAAVAIGSFFAAALAFLPPVLLLGCVSPFALRLLTNDVRSSGNTAGALYALSTVGSLLGTYLSAFVAIPLLGTRATIMLCAFILIALSTIGLWMGNGRVKAGLFLLIPLAIWIGLGSGPVKSQPGLIIERETPYQFVQVVDKQGTKHLLINEGGGIQSVYAPGRRVYGWYSDYLVPLSFLPPGRQRDVLIVGFAGGTLATQMRSVLGDRFDLRIQGVEIDPFLNEVARQEFGVTDQVADLAAADGRLFLAHTPNRYDFIVVDAYSREMYIPFHLATREFYSLAKDRLETGGVLVLNANTTRRDSKLLASLIATLQSVFPHVYLTNVPGWYNRLLVASVRELDTQRLDLAGNVPDFAPVIDYLKQNLRPLERSSGVVLTDDRAPTELLTDWMVMRYAIGERPES